MAHPHINWDDEEDAPDLPPASEQQLEAPTPREPFRELPKEAEEDRCPH